MWGSVGLGNVGKLPFEAISGVAGVSFGVGLAANFAGTDGTLVGCREGAFVGLCRDMSGQDDFHVEYVLQ